ncbi:MAG: glycosyltransferase family 4 protein [Nostoc sp. DedVER02]|uniref:glycosyltransferase family 4 protein n=1 Tax=unclassified Nostoc TaxID=2593658 RepID=UPI002AD3E624|nr:MULTISPECIES: glycosyltransferase family 4 protein [unclassified Nostoc]MDZ7990401.1 glycosyltransferase family 4 protein [Nostoc sp. DedVER02]MDZ8115907.1 glycosyltransferase family 4 protein [Nostoc sp. DedVER01b]
MRIFFLDQSGKPGGAELCLIDIAKPYCNRALVGLFADGPFKELLQQNDILVEILATQAIQVHKESSLVQGLKSVRQLAPLITKVIKKAREYDLIYANTQKALVVGALASFFSHRPLVYHLHDILSKEHFSQTNLRIAINLANRFASLVIANSQASKTAFIQAGGRPDIIEVVYNGFDPKIYQIDKSDINKLQENLGLQGKFVVGHFSRLAPWKGQHILIDALAQCPQEVTAILVGDALFGEQDYVKQLHQQVADLGLENRVKFLGFRSDIPQLMAACDLVAHTSTSPEPFGRVIVEAMLCEKPIVAAKAGGVMELVEHGLNGFLVTPGEPQELAQVITTCLQETEITATIANNARTTATRRFDIATINQQIAQLLSDRF